MTLQQMVLWVKNHTTEGVAQKLLDMQMELKAYREKFSLHAYNKQTGSIEFKTGTKLNDGDSTGKYERVAEPVEVKAEVPIPEDWRLVTMTNAMKSIKLILGIKK